MDPHACMGPLHETAFRMVRVPPGHVARWLRLGWRDLRRSGWPSWLHGVLVSAVSLLLARAALFDFYLLPGLATAFVLVGPMLATGLYGLSRRLEQGDRPRLKDALCAWWTASQCLWGFSGLLVLVGLGWIAASAALFHLFIDEDVYDAWRFLYHVLTQDEHHFLLWTVAGALVAALVFAMTVVAVPLLLERNVTTRTAVLASIRAVGENPVTMALWALTIALLTLLGVATAMLGFIVIYPLLGHASWRLYRDVVRADDRLAPKRTDHAP